MILPSHNFWPAYFHPAIYSCWFCVCEIFDCALLPKKKNSGHRQLPFVPSFGTDEPMILVQTLSHWELRVLYVGIRVPFVIEQRFWFSDNHYRYIKKVEYFVNYKIMLYQISLWHKFETLYKCSKVLPVCLWCFSSTHARICIPEHSNHKCKS